MLAAALLASWWAQAEPAPTVPTAPPPASAAPAPASAAPAPASAAPAPAPVLDNSVGVYGSFAYRAGSEGQTIGPRDGFSIGGDYERRYFATPGGFELTGGLDFFYDRFATNVSDPALLDVGLSERIISQTSFALMQTAGWRLGRVRPFAKVGLGVSLAYFSSPEAMFRPGSFDAVQPFLRAGGGVSVVIAHDVAVSLQGMYSYPFTRPVYTTDDGTSYSFLGPLLDLGLGMVMQF